LEIRRSPAVGLLSALTSEIMCTTSH
jgi:hypothetical protein